MRIIAYTYEAAFHCPACTRRRFGFVGEVRNRAFENGRCDEQGVALITSKVVGNDGKVRVETRGPLDTEGNEVRPVFSTDETDNEYCDDCNRRITA